MGESVGITMWISLSLSLFSTTANSIFRRSLRRDSFKDWNNVSYLLNLNCLWHAFGRLRNSGVKLDPMKFILADVYNTIFFFNLLTIYLLYIESC